jgi:hypothetical protein
MYANEVFEFMNISARMSIISEVNRGILSWNPITESSML